MFLRFRASYIDLAGEKSSGVFQAAAFLRNNEIAENDDDDMLHELKDWFNEHLEPPSQFTKRKTGKETGNAISWYRDSANEHIAKMHALSRILEKYGVVVEMVRREDPGYIVYEDDIQVAALPYREDRDRVL